MRGLPAVLAVALCGCASAPLEGAPRVESRRFTVVSDVDPGALELALPVLDAVDEELTRRWGFEDRGRRELLLFADEPTWDAFEAAEKPDGERWHGSGFGHDGAIALEVPPRSKDDLGGAAFEQVRRLVDAGEVVSRVSRELFLCRLREQTGPKLFKAAPKELAVGAGEVERTAAMARLDGGLEAPYEPGRSEVERALGALAEALAADPGPDGKSPLERERALGLALRVHPEDLRACLLGEGPVPISSSTPVEAATRRLVEVVLRHPSERYVRAAGPTLRLLAAMNGLQPPIGADPSGWRTAAADLEAALVRPSGEPRAVDPAELEALLLELGVKESARAKWAEALRGQR